MRKELKIISLSEIKTEEVKWLWYPYIPFGKVTIVQGDPGEGKTTFVLCHRRTDLRRGSAGMRDRTAADERHLPDRRGWTCRYNKASA